MPRKRAKIKQRIEPVEPWLLKYLATGVRPERDENGCLECFMLEGSEEEVKKAWQKHRALILKDWIKRKPGTRPYMWWRFDAPRWQKSFNGAWFDGKLPEPRQRIGGIGTPQYECLAVVPSFKFGIPYSWVSKFQEDYHNGRFKCNDSWFQARYDRDGRKEGDFEGVALDLDDPPTFESQASYIKRHNLLTKPEEKRLKPADFQPESCLKYIKTYEK